MIKWWHFQITNHMEKIVVENSEILMFYVMKISFNSDVCKSSAIELSNNMY